MTAFPKFTDEGIADLRSLIGIERKITSYHNSEVCRDNIRRFALGSGDDNPLWLDEEYARGTCWGGIIAPPCFIRTLGIPLPQKLPGVHAQFAGEEFHFDKPVRLGDRITASLSLVDVVEKESSFAKRTFHEIEEVKYLNQDGDQVSRYRRLYIRHERDSSRARRKYEDIQPAMWTPEDLRRFENYCLSEKRQGAVLRRWEDIEIDEEIPLRLRGPLTVSDVLWHYIAEGGIPFSYGMGLSYKMKKKQPAWFIVNSQGAYEAIPSCHWDWDFAKRIGAPGPYDTPSLRSACISFMITDWIGDNGWLKQLSVESRRFMILGDIIYYKGKVVDKYIQEDQYLAKLEIWGENQRGECTTQSQAVVALPSR
ncbi:MaoC family dehydratase N-terminal domain-containing protein [Chloroflexota bacterium]